MVFEDFHTKPSVVIAYTGEGKGKTSAALGLLARALGTGWQVLFVQFIKYWDVGEHAFFKDISGVYEDKLTIVKGGKGFYAAGQLTTTGVSDEEHRQEATRTYDKALAAAKSGQYQLVVCDEINNAVHDGLLDASLLEKLIKAKHIDTNLCLTGRNFPDELLPLVDIATEMRKVKHHFDDKYLANKGIDY
jgi:cob(I)alamin adenosyltransferase